MTRRMLIDATHEEETRVAIVEGNRLVEFDYESKYRKPLKGSIFLAKVTRVEPSLQAAFVNFGGNRHGFLPFSEIHPDYFRIPIADREALIAEQEAMAAREEEEAHQHDEQAQGRDEEEHLPQDDESFQESAEEQQPLFEDGGSEEDAHPDHDHDMDHAHGEDGHGDDEDDSHEDDSHEDDHHDVDTIEEVGGATEESHEGEEGFHAEPGNEAQAEQPGLEQAEGQEQDGQQRQEGEGFGGRRRGRGRRGGRNRRGGRGRMAHRSRQVEMVGGDDAGGDERRLRYRMRRQYKIQEVIKRGQIMLIQVSKEERGNKGAAVSTYLSLPGRYCVLMPNSPRAGGVSRKIANYQDRVKMKEMLDEMNTPPGMSVIVRTAGVSRTKAEVKRDLDYLMRLWDTIREDTLKSTAPAMIYEEADLIKRAIRDLYGRDVEDIHVAGEEGYKTAKAFMKMMMPSHVKKVHLYDDDKIPLFHRYRIESQISDIGESRVTLRSGGYLVINPTEALVSIDVNSGKATKERHIEETALKTNLEAADELARQLRLRDLGGLVVVDFIDMEDRRNNAKVERRLKEALSSDRARVQIGRISSFGLLELSRQRLNPSLIEAQYERCPHCKGVGMIRTADATSIVVLRAVEEEGIKGRAKHLIAHVSNSVALYVMNHKRNHLAELERRYNFTVQVLVDESLGESEYRIEIVKAAKPGEERPLDAELVEEPAPVYDTEDEADDHGHAEGDEEMAGDSDEDSESALPDNYGGQRQQRQQGEWRGNGEGRPEGEGGRRRRRGRRGGRRRRRGRGGQQQGGEGDNNREARQDYDQQQPQDNRGRYEDRGQQRRGGGRHQQRRERFEQDGTGDIRAEQQAFHRQQQQQGEDGPANDFSESYREPSQRQEPMQEQRQERSAPRERAPSDHETVNKAPVEKKRGWWNRLTE